MTTRIAILGADTLLGRELKDTLAKRRDLWDDLRLLAAPGTDDEASAVTELEGEAMLILPATAENLGDVDLLFYCTEATEAIELPAGLPEGATTIVVSNGEAIEDYVPVVAGLEPGAAGTGDTPHTVASAHPGSVALAHLLAPLLALGLESCEASVVLPSSTEGQDGIDELLTQTRSILAFQPRESGGPFDYQLAFNVAPVPGTGRKIARTVERVLAKEGLRVSAQASRGGVFHSLLVSAHVRLPATVGEVQIREALEGSPLVEFSEQPETLGPIDAAGASRLSVGLIEASDEAGGFWLRAVMDNLTAGGALNAVAIAEAVLAGRVGDSLTN